MARRKKKLARSELAKGSPRDPSSKSQYALKIIKRKRLAQSLGLPSDTTYPVIWTEQERRKPRR